MKKFLLLFAAVATLLTACENDCGHDFIEVDYSQDIVGTWTCLEADYAEAIIINADGTAVSTGCDGDYYWEDVKGTIEMVNNKIAMTFEDDDNFEGSFDLVPGETLSLVDGTTGERTNYRYCANDLSDEIVGMWVCNSGLESVENDMVINTFDENGKSHITTFLADENDYVVNKGGDYKVVGNILIKFVKDDSGTTVSHIVIGLDYMHNGTELGDIMAMYMPAYGTTHTFLRIKQSLDLPGKKYDYIKTFITNAKGQDKDIEFFNSTINFAKIDNSMFDKFLKATLFGVQFPDANTIEYSFLLGEQLTPMQAPIKVEGNKMVIKMSELNAVYRDIEVYTFQDQDNTQMHMYMPTSSFENFLGNMQLSLMLSKGQLDLNDAAAVKAVFDTIENAIETINVSLVMSKATK